MMIWDLHCHLGAVDGATPHERMAALMRMADRVGVERVVIFMGWPHQVDPTPEELRRQNDQVLEALSHWHDRAFGFVYLSPNHVEASLQELKRCIEHGPMVGVKLWVARRCSDAAVDPLVAEATRLKAVVYQHTWLKTTGNLAGESTPEDLVVLAKRHPEATLICGHSGGAWELGIRAIRPQENIWLGIGGFDPTAGVTEMAVRELGAERVIFGSDAAGRSFASQMAKVHGAKISPQDKEHIFGGNLKRLLTPILQAKGVRA